MIRVELIRWIGVSHALQLPLTLLLASSYGLNLAGSLQASSRLASAVAHNMAIASVSLPTALGFLLALRAPHALTSGTTRDLALLLAAFWSWRLFRQLRALGPAWPERKRALHLALSAIFVVQGPVLGGLLW